MNQNSRYNLEELNQLHERALAEARQLRREAIDDFWRGANGMLGQAALSAQRAAVRFGQRLRRHSKASARLPALPSAMG